CQAGLAKPTANGTPLLDDAPTLALSPVGSVLSVAQAVISATVRIAAAVRAIGRGAWCGNSVTRTGMLSPCAMYALRLRRRVGRKQKNRPGDCASRVHMLSVAPHPDLRLGSDLSRRR